MRAAHRTFGKFMIMIKFQLLALQYFKGPTRKNKIFQLK